MNKIIGEEWKALSDGERAPFQEMADKDKERYQQEVAAGGVADAKKKGSKAAPAPRVKSSYQVVHYLSSCSLYSCPLFFCDITICTHKHIIAAIL